MERFPVNQTEIESEEERRQDWAKHAWKSIRFDEGTLSYDVYKREDFSIESINYYY